MGFLSTLSPQYPAGRTLCWPKSNNNGRLSAGPDGGARWPARLVSTASENRLSGQRLSTEEHLTGLQLDAGHCATQEGPSSTTKGVENLAERAVVATVAQAGPTVALACHREPVAI